MKMPAVVLGIALSASATQTGCYFTFGAIASHNSRGSSKACKGVEELTPLWILDLALAGAGVGLALKYESNSAWVGAGVFGASGVLGSITTLVCGIRGDIKAKRDDEPQEMSLPRRGDSDSIPAPNSGTTSATEPIAPESSESGKAEAAKCSLTPLVQCAANEVCRLDDGGNDGVCVPEK